MPHLSVVILTQDEEQRSILKVQVEDTAIARVAGMMAQLPVSPSDPLVRRIQGLGPDVLLVDIPANDPPSALRAIEMLHGEMPTKAIFAIGDLNQPQVIVNAMRAGAREFLDRPTRTNQLLEAFARHTTTRQKSGSKGPRGKIYSVVNAKGGSGATTIAVNTALSLQSSTASVALVDMAPLGHLSLHLNLKSSFTVLDAMQNLHRMDQSLLESYMVRHAGGLRLLAGPPAPLSLDVPASQLAKLCDLLIEQFQHVVVDFSNRLDAATRIISDLSHRVLIVAQADVTSLWSASKVQHFLADGAAQEKCRLVMNRFRKIPGFSDSEAENVTRSKILWKLPNHFPLVSAAIDKGVPVAQQNHSEIARSFNGLAAALQETPQQPARSAWTLFRAS